MNEIWLTREEVSALENIKVRAFWKRFRAGQYKNYRYLDSGKGGRGGKKLEIGVSSLEAGLRARVIQERESAYMKGTILPSRGDLSLGEAKKLIKDFESAPAWSRRKAEARAEIIKGFNNFSSGQRLTPAKESFINKYNVWNPELGVSPETYQLIPKLTRPTLDRWRADHKQFGLVGLLVRGDHGKGTTKIDPEIRKYIISLISAKPHTRSRRIYEYCENKFSSKQTPSEVTVRRFITAWKEEKKGLYAFLRNPDKWRSEFQLSLGDAAEKAKHFLHMVEFDSTPADIMCADKKRYAIVGAIDIFSRKAKCMLVPVSKSVAIANLMRWIIINWGLFDVMIADNGKDYASRHIEAVCGALGIELQPTPPFTPDAKPFIERFFRTLAGTLFEELSGYIGHNVAERREIESQESFAQRMFNNEVIECRMMPNEVQAVIDIWIDKVYHQGEHSGLKKSPEARAGESSQPVRKIMDERALDILLAPCGHPTVQKKGIRYKNGNYAAPELGDYVKRKVEIREDLADAGKLHVLDARSKEFICIARDAALEGLTVEEVNKARKQQRKTIREEARALKTLAKEVGDPMLDLLEAKSKEAGQIVAFHKEEKAEGTMIQGAEKALSPPEPRFKEFQPDPEKLKAVQELTQESNEKVVQLFEQQPIFETSLERYKYLLHIDRGLTDKERAWCKRYEESKEYYRIFVMPYEESSDS